MYVRSLRVENLRCFKSAEVELQFPGRKQKSPPPLPNVNLLSGNNGAGKTTVLKAIALGVLAPIIEGSGYVPHGLVRRGVDEHGTGLDAGIGVNLFLHPDDNSSGRFGATMKEFRSDLTIQRIKSHERLVPESGTTRAIQKFLRVFGNLSYEDSKSVPLVALRSFQQRLRESGFIPLSALFDDESPASSWWAMEQRGT